LIKEISLPACIIDLQKQVFRARNNYQALLGIYFCFGDLFKSKQNLHFTASEDGS
jgi:hypothetical protein